MALRCSSCTSPVIVAIFLLSPPLYFLDAAILMPTFTRPCLRSPFAFLRSFSFWFFPLSSRVNLKKKKKRASREQKSSINFVHRTRADGMYSYGNNFLPEETQLVIATSDQACCSPTMRFEYLSLGTLRQVAEKDVRSIAYPSLAIFLFRL